MKIAARSTSTRTTRSPWRRSDAHPPARGQRGAPDAGRLTPRKIVAELDRHIVGQAAAKRAVAIALRNRIRRQRLPPEMADEITPKNILMIGPTGVGKTEIARRLAKLAGSPFVKVEASKFTEVGYVGRDVESIVRDLVEVGVDMVRRRSRRGAGEGAGGAGGAAPRPAAAAEHLSRAPEDGGGESAADSFRATRESCASSCEAGRSSTARWRCRSPSGLPHLPVLQPGPPGRDGHQPEGSSSPGSSAAASVAGACPVAEAREVLRQEEEELLVTRAGARSRAGPARAGVGDPLHRRDRQDRGAGGRARPRRLPRGRAAGPAADRGGHHRAHQVRAGADGPRALHRRRRLPREQAVRPHPRAAGPLPHPRGAEPLAEAELVRILLEPRSSLSRSTRRCSPRKASSCASRTRRWARSRAFEVNRRPRTSAPAACTPCWNLLEEISFEAAGPSAVTIDVPEVRRKLEPLVKNQDLSRFIL